MQVTFHGRQRGQNLTSEQQEDKNATALSRQRETHDMKAPEFRRNWRKTFTYILFARGYI